MYTSISCNGGEDPNEPPLSREEVNLARDASVVDMGVGVAEEAELGSWLIRVYLEGKAKSKSVDILCHLESHYKEVSNA